MRRHSGNNQTFVYPLCRCHRDREPAPSRDRPVPTRDRALRTLGSLFLNKHMRINRHILSKHFIPRRFEIIPSKPAQTPAGWDVGDQGEMQVDLSMKEAERTAGFWHIRSLAWFATSPPSRRDSSHRAIFLFFQLYFINTNLLIENYFLFRIFPLCF